MGRDWESTFAEETVSSPFFKALIIAALAERVVGSATITGVLEVFLDLSNEMECAEYLLDSRVCSRVSIEP